MIEVGLKVNTVRLKSDGEVHVYKYGSTTTLCEKNKVQGNATRLGEEATCKNCWGQLYLRLSLEIDNLFGYPTPADVRELEEKVEAA